MKKSLFILLTIIFITSCCKEDNSQNQYCGAENPAKDLDWLRIEIKNKQIAFDSIEVYKMEMPTYDEIGFLFQYESQVPHQKRAKYYYTCKGTVVCYDVGGILGSNCNDQQLNDLILGELVYQSY